jgi:hypothetical protein
MFLSLCGLGPPESAAELASPETNKRDLDWDDLGSIPEEAGR